MCGIVGIRTDTLTALRGDFAAALAALRWRGPDGVAEVTHGGWRLGIARLAITDPAAPQPLFCPATGRAIVFNGAVTSAPREWREFGAGRRTTNDAELPLLRLRHAGEAQLAPSAGHHAFAVVDAQGVGYLARDQFGEKPLYVVRDRGAVVAFASSVAALRRLGLTVTLAQPELASCLWYGWHATPRLHHAELSLDDTLAGVVRLTDSTEVPQVQEVDDTRSLRERVRAAVARCAHAEVGVALALSGGVDSACIAASLPRSPGQRLPAFQFCARGEPGDERALAQLVAGHCGVALHLVDAGAEVLHELPALTAALGLPVGDPSTLAAHAVARAAAAAGARVLLSGEGGDELWFGYRRHRAARWLPRRGWPWLPAPQRAMGGVARLWRALASREPYASLLLTAPPALLGPALAPELRDPPALHLSPGDHLTSAVNFDREVYLRRDLLVKLDLATMAAGMEGRCPFLDAEVVRAPEAQLARARAGLGKLALRRAFTADLPSAVLRQRKVGFGVPLDRWLREDDFVADTLRDRRSRERAHVDATGLTRLLDAHRAGRVSAGRALYQLVAVEFYLRSLSP